MKKITAGIGITTCVALCAAVWLLRSQVGDLAAEPLKTSVNAGFEAWSEETSEFVSSADTYAAEEKTVAKTEPPEDTVISEKETEQAPPAEAAPRSVSKSAPVTSELKAGTTAVIDGNRCMWIPGFGWIEDNGGGNVGTVAEDMYENGHKIGIMD
jgi:hypothetical protein